MKKILFLLLCSTFSIVATAQLTYDRHWDIKAHEVGQLHFQLGVALPVPHWNADSSTLEIYTDRIDNGAFKKFEKEKVYDLFGGGPLYLRFEYGLTRKLSINAGITYTNYKARFSRDSVDATIGKPIPYEYGVRVNNISYMARLNYHLFTNTRWDLLIGGGVGYDTYTATSYTKYPPQSLLFDAKFKAPAPVTFEAGAGFRYFFLNRTAVYFEAGYGKTYIQAGVIVKISQPKLNRSF